MTQNILGFFFGWEGEDQSEPPPHTVHYCPGGTSGVRTRDDPHTNKRFDAKSDKFEVEKAGSRAASSSSV